MSALFSASDKAERLTRAAEQLQSVQLDRSGLEFSEVRVIPNALNA